MRKLYLYNEWHNGDILTNRALIIELLKYNFDIAVGSYRNRHYLVADLPVKHIIANCDEEDKICSGCPGCKPQPEKITPVKKTPSLRSGVRRHGKPAPPPPPIKPKHICESRIGLASLCPEGYQSVNTWCGTFKDIDARGFHNWRTIVDTFNRQTGLDIQKGDTPMLDFRVHKKIKIEGRGIYLENSPARSPHCFFNFNIDKITSHFPEFKFYCTGSSDCKNVNFIDCSKRDLIEMSFISNQCEAIVGRGSGPFFCTFTEVNRFKPRAVVDFVGPHFWEYKNSPLRYLKGETELFNFLSDVRNNFWEIL